MLGKHHAVFGGAAFVAVAQVGQMGLRPAQLAVGTAVTMGAALVPDLDEPGASASRSFGRIGRSLSHVIAKLSGGHRGGTHTLPAVAAAGLGVTAALGHPTVLAVLCGLLVVVGLDVLPQVREGTEWIVGALVAVGAQQVIGTTDVWPVAAVIAGWLSHMVGDTLTPHGVPWCWPLRDLDETTSLGWFRSGSWAEPVVTWSLVGGLLLVAGQA